MNFSFTDHVTLLDQFIVHRSDIAERIEEVLLNVRGKETSRRRDRNFFDRTLNECFFSVKGVDPKLALLNGQLAASHLIDGFEPIHLGGYLDEFDPLDLIIRAYEFWDSRRWPGKSGRVAYAQSIYSAFMLRQLESLSLRIWDDGNTHAGDRLQTIQHLLDNLNASGVQQVHVRDVRWLVQTAQGPLTKYLEPYFRIATHISESFTEPIRLDVHVAGAKLAGGHLRSQLRYRALETNRQMEDPVILATARNSNSMDGALLLRDLVPLLKAYEIACAAHDTESRLDLADAILQGMSGDPELFLTRLDLLGPLTMIEGLFIDRDNDGRARYTELGRAQAKLLGEYRELLGRLAEFMKDDATVLAPSQDQYSPYGICYGFVADLLSNLALDTLMPRPPADLSFEEMFASRGSLDAKLARARMWAELPKRAGERDHFYHSPEFAAQNFSRLMAALNARALRKTDLNASNHPDARIFVVTETDLVESLPGGSLPAGIARVEEHCYTSNFSRALSGTITAVPAKQILADRNEGRFLASDEFGGEWFAVSKVILTLFTSRGRDALISGVALGVIDVLRLTCPGLIAMPAENPAVPNAASS